MSSNSKLLNCLVRTGAARARLACQINHLLRPRSCQVTRLYSDAAAPSLIPTIRAFYLSHERGKCLRISFNNKKTSTTVDLHSLRDACECLDCVDLLTGHKKFPSTQIPDTLLTKNVKVEDGCLHIEWESDFRTPGQSHHSRYPYIQQLLLGNIVDAEEYKTPPRILWNKEMIERSLVRVPFNGWMGGGDDLAEGVIGLHHHGIVIVQGGPKDERAVEAIVNQIGNLHETFRGRTWDEISQSSGDKLNLEQDMLYVNSGNIPRIKAMYCLDNDADGGEIIFSDGVRAARQFYPIDELKALESVQLRFRLHAEGHDFEALHPVFANNGDQRRVMWAPSLQHPRQQIEDPRHYWAAARKFERLINMPENQLTITLQPGECVLFDNSRIPSGREDFQVKAGGLRWFKGAYISDDVFTSKLRGFIGRPFPDFEPAGETELAQVKRALRINKLRFNGFRKI